MVLILYIVLVYQDIWQCGSKYTAINLQTLQNKNMILLLQNDIRGGISSVMCDRYVKSYENNKILYVDANNLYGYSMSQSLPYDEIKFDKIVNLEDILNTPEDSDFGYLVDIDLKYTAIIKENTKPLPFAPENKKINPDDFGDYLNEIKSKKIYNT